MDERQTQIKSGAGLEESRINQDFLNFLNKWSSPFLIVLSVAALVWAGLGYLERQKLEKVDRAFGDLHDTLADGNPSPSSLMSIASEYEGVRSVPELAKLAVVDLYLDAYLRGVAPGAEIAPATGLPVDESQALDDQQRLTYLDQAGSLVNEIIDATSGDPEKAMLTLNALSRAAAVAESRGEFEEALNQYAKLQALARAHEFPAIAIFAQRRADHIDALNPDIALPSNDDLAPLPGETRPTAAGSTEVPPEIQAQLDEMLESLKSDETGVDVTSPDDLGELPEIDLTPGDPAPSADPSGSDEP